MENKNTINEFLNIVLNETVKSDFIADETSPYAWGSHEYPESKHYVFLGGTCANSTWRKTICDFLSEHKISYFQPQSNDWKDSMMEAEDKAKKKADIQLFVLSPEMTGFYSLVEILEMIMQCNAGNLCANSLRIGVMGDLSAASDDKQIQKGINKTMSDLFGDLLPKPTDLIIKQFNSSDELITLLDDIQN